MKTTRTRRVLLRMTTGTALATSMGSRLSNAAVPFPETPGERPAPRPAGISVGNPYGGRVPVSFIIDDSTCLVNMGHYCIPQFAEAWGRYQDLPWKKWPREIPDDFVRKFGDFCKNEGVKGKYSIVPNPALVGWVDREMPGWSIRELKASRDLVRDFMMPDWDIHPEMISHTRVLDIKTGRPLPRRPMSEGGGFWMENGGWCAGKSVDQIAEYIAYALQILKNADLPCEGFTTPGGFGNPAKEFLETAGRQAITSVFPETEIPHYFKYVLTDPGESTNPRVENASGLGGTAAECIVNVPCCTGDWFGAWHGGAPNPTEETINRHITADFKGGRMAEVINKGEVSAFLTHWPDLYSNGEDTAFAAFRGIVKRLNAGYGDRIVWMKLSEIARYWAAKELTAIDIAGDKISLNAPFSAPGFTLDVAFEGKYTVPSLTGPKGQTVPFSRIDGDKWRPLRPGECRIAGKKAELCFDLTKGKSVIS